MGAYFMTIRLLIFNIGTIRMYVFRAFIALFAILLGTISTAQDATNSMTFTIDGTELALVTSPILKSYPSTWERMGRAIAFGNLSVKRANGA
jgi:hypothetical protein